MKCLVCICSSSAMLCPWNDLVNGRSVFKFPGNLAELEEATGKLIIRSLHRFVYWHHAGSGILRWTLAMLLMGSMLVPVAQPF